MKIRLILLIVFSVFVSASGFTQENIDMVTEHGYRLEVIENKDFSKISEPKIEGKTPRESKRFVAAVLCLALGPFGMHRLYLGSTPQVAAAYSVTLGAIGIVPAVDFLLISFSKDISRFKNNGKVIMWGK
jgi:TM2 domain-containing membrane protein YozV